jgi:hypothetical protein
MTKISALTADTSPTSDDLVVTVNDPGGTPANRKVTAANLVTKAHGLSDGLVKVATGTMAAATAGTDYVTADSTNTLTNKTIDANGTGNSITNIEVADLAAGVLDTDLSSVSASDDTIPSAKATKTALDGKASTSHTHAIDDLSDVTITTPSNGQVLKYNGSAWVNDTDATGGGGANAFTTFAADGGTSPQPDTTTDTLTIAGGTGITTTGDSSTDTVTIDIDSTVATLTGSQTLTNKTLTAPIISSISNTGTVTLPTATDTLVGRATTDTLTNKTLTSPVIDTGVSGTAIDTDGTLAANSDTKLASQKAVKTYVDTGLGTKAATSHSHAASDITSGQIAMANGGTGANLTDPNADRLMFWDDSAGAVTWLTAGSGLTISDTTISAAGGSSGEYFRQNIYGGVYTPTTSEIVIGTGGTGSAVANHSNGLRISTGANSTSLAYVYANLGSTAATMQNLLDRNSKYFVYLSFLADNSDNKMFFGYGASWTSTSADPDLGTARKIIGFRIHRDAGATTVYAVTGNGTNETATDVTGSLDGFSAGDGNKPSLFWFTHETGVNVKFYHNTTLLTTITTNLPTGTFTTTAFGPGGLITNNVDGASGNHAYIRTMYYEQKVL